MKRIILVMLFLLSFSAEAAYLPPAEGKQGMVVSAEHNATQVGLQILQEGGNAVDAAVAMGYALAVVHPCCGNLGGGGFMLIHLARGKDIFVNFREKAPAHISGKLFFNPDGSLNKKKALQGYLPVGIPGTVMGLNTALKKYGSMPLKHVMRPAIDLAKNGYRLEAGDIKFLNYGLPFFKAQNNVAKIFLNHGKPYESGDVLKQPALAKTLEAISKKGSDVFYSGWIAKALVKASQENGGVLTLDDFKHYTVQLRKPIICYYRGYTVLTDPPPSSGITVCEILNIVSGYPLGKEGFHSAASAHNNIEAMRYSFADRNTFLGDPDFVHNPIRKLLSLDYAQFIREKIQPNKAGNSKALGIQISFAREKPNTTQYTVTDKYGNAVSTTVTLNGFFGSKVIAGDTGFFLNNELDDFALKVGVPNAFQLVQGKANLIEPNKRPLSSMSPTIVLKKGNVFIALGAAGGSTIITSIVEAIEHVVDNGMNINAAVNSPRYHMQWLPDVTYLEPFCFSKDTLRLLKKMGYQFYNGSVYGTKYWGQMAAVQKDPKTAINYGANDNRRPSGLAKGY